MVRYQIRALKDRLLKKISAYLKTDSELCNYFVHLFQNFGCMAYPVPCKSFWKLYSRI